MSVVVRVENVSKKYQLGTIGTQSLKGDFNRWWSKIRGKADPFVKIGGESQHQNGEFWALKDINFEVNQGDAVGIIGKNGAGKSTLLKILSRITNPTTGSVKIKGRIASLLEVGTGFNPDLTGRENIFLNGAILGMTKREVKVKFDEIVDFSGIEQFIDTPVKRYSSGMYVRLAFAVAAHLESEILILDEVLAVGDAEFQKKCLGKMDDVAHKQGRTILFVSHNMLAMQALCKRGVMLHKGVSVMQDQISKVIQYYNDEGRVLQNTSIAERTDRAGSGIVRFTSFGIKNLSGEDVLYFITGKGAKIALYFENVEKKDLKNLQIALGINDHAGVRITHLNNQTTDEIFPHVPSFVDCIEIDIGKLSLMPGKYTAAVYAAVNGEVADWVPAAIQFEVEPGDFYGTGKLIPQGQGNFLVEHRFQIKDYQTKI